jgi:RES domain-containing protein
MLSPAEIAGEIGALAAKTRPRFCSMVRAMPARYWRDPFAHRMKKARRNWNRFNVKQGTRVLYLGDDYLTAAHETGVNLVPTWIVAFAPVRCSLQAVLDLTDPDIQAILQTDSNELGANFRAVPVAQRPTPTQSLGEALAREKQIDALWYESSARPGSRCLAVFVAALKPLGGTLEVFDPKSGVTKQLP